MAGNIPTDYRVGDKICIQDGQCGEVVATAENGVELKLDNGDGVSVPTGNLDHGTLKIGGGDYVPLSDMIINYKFKNLTELAPKPTRAHIMTTEKESEMFKGHMKPAEPLKDTPIQHTREFPEEYIRHVLTPEQEELFIERFEKAIEIYKETAKPAEAERLSEGLEKLIKDFHERQKREEGLRGEGIRMERESFKAATEWSIKKATTITPEQIDRLKQLILDTKKNKE